MTDTYVFSPPRRTGFLFNSFISLLLIVGGGWNLWRASLAQTGPVFLLHLLMALAGIGLAPLFIYRLRALLRATYTLERDGIHLRWGLRSEDIPMDQVLWVSLAEDLEPDVPLPWLRWPGSVLGTRHEAGATIEFFAATSSPLIVIATSERIFATSPEDPDGFLAAFQSLTQMGSLAPVQATSIYPAFLMVRVWNDRAARVMLLLGVFLSLLLLVWVGLIIPGQPEVPLKLAADGSALDFVPSVHLLLLPTLNGMFFGVNFLLGLFFYRKGDGQKSQADADKGKTLAYLLMGSGVLTPLLFLGAVFYILRAG